MDTAIQEQVNLDREGFALNLWHEISHGDYPVPVDVLVAFIEALRAHDRSRHSTRAAQVILREAETVERRTRRAVVDELEDLHGDCYNAVQQVKDVIAGDRSVFHEIWRGPADRGYHKGIQVCIETVHRIANNGSA